VGSGVTLAGRYRVGEPIGRGGMSMVFRGYDELLHRDVAIKVLGPLATSATGSRQEFLGEARAAAALQHPNIASIFDVGVHGTDRFIVMEYVPGGSLLDLIQARAPLPPDRSVALGTQVADALDYGHRHGIVHCDVKPQNVLLDETGRPKLVDFGISRSIAATGALTDTISGTAGYIAPEQLLGERLDGRADIYALGCVIYEMLTGELPFDSSNLAALATQRLVRPPTPLLRKNPRVPAALAESVMRAIERERDQRYSSAHEFSLSLAKSLTGEALAPGPTSRNQTTALTRPRPTQSNVRRETLVQSRPQEGGRLFWPVTLVLLGILILAGAVAAIELPSFVRGGGTSSVPVPNLVGQSLTNAVGQLHARHLSVELKPQDTSASVQCTGVVLDQSPQAASQIDSTGTVTLTVSQSDRC
jgi:serine/threonine-protein kinase